MMSALTNNNCSFICSGSDFNRRSFGENESWNSLQSTILAGQWELTANQNNKKIQKLTTVDEEGSMIVLEDDCNFLDMNIDAMSTDSVFGDSEKSDVASNTEVVSFPDTVSSHDSGIANGTGYLLQRMFEDMEKCATHSTPSDSHHPSHRTHEMSQKRFDFERDSLEESTMYDDLSAMSRNTPMVIRHTRVAEMKQHFEEILRGSGKSKIPVKRTSPTLKIYQANAQSKKSKIPVLKKPTASCSEMSIRSGSRPRANRSKSESDATNGSVRVVWDNRHVTRRKVKGHVCFPSNNSSKHVSIASSKNSTKSSSTTSRSQKSVSSLNTRKSLGFISSPIKSVQVIRKIFSPSPRTKNGTVNCTGRTNCTTSRFPTPGGPKKTRRDVPKIVVTPCRD